MPRRHRDYDYYDRYNYYESRGDWIPCNCYFDEDEGLTVTCEDCLAEQEAQAQAARKAEEARAARLAKDRWCEHKEAIKSNLDYFAVWPHDRFMQVSVLADLFRVLAREPDFLKEFPKMREVARGRIEHVRTVAPTLEGDNKVLTAAAQRCVVAAQDLEAILDEIAT